MQTSKRTVLRDALAISAAVGVFGFSFGILAVTGGLSVGKAVALSSLVFAGGSQFAALGVVTAGGSALAAVAAGLLLNTRYAAFGLAISPVLGGSLPRRAVAAQLVIDESSALALGQRDPEDARRAFWLTGTILFALWNAGTLIGALGGSSIADPAALGLDAAFPAGFLALLVPLLRDRRTRIAGGAGAVIAVVLSPLVPPGVNIVAAALGALIALRVPAGKSSLTGAAVAGGDRQ